MTDTRGPNRETLNASSIHPPRYAASTQEFLMLRAARVVYSLLLGAQSAAGGRPDAAAAGAEIEIVEAVAPEAYTALLANDAATHDELLSQAVANLQNRDVSAIVLAQVSMARTLPLIERTARVPVLTSLHTSLEAIREALSLSS
jgi:hypothetical protein